MEGIHDIFHVSMFRRYIANPTHVISVVPITFQLDLTCEEKPIEILDIRT
jgi:hypothetical protein